MPIAVNPIFPVIASQATSPAVALQPGSVIDAQVLKILANDFVRIAIADLSIEVLSEIPLQPGQTLKLAVSQSPDGIRLSVVAPAPGEGSAANLDPADTVTLTPDAPVTAANKTAAIAPAKAGLLTPAEALAVSAAAQTAATRQASLAPLFADLGVAAGAPALPADVRAAAAQLLALRPNLDQTLGGGEVKAAFQQSGLLFEARLATQSVGSPTAEPLPDLKAALIVLRQTLLSSAEQPTSNTAAGHSNAASPNDPIDAPLPQVATAPRLAPEHVAGEPHEVLLPQAADAVNDDVETAVSYSVGLSANANVASTRNAPIDAIVLDLLQEALTAEPRSGSALHVLADDRDIGPLSQQASVAEPHDGDIARTNVPPPPFRGALPSAQSIASPSLAPDFSSGDAVSHLLQGVDGAIARQTLLQAASLPDRSDPSGAPIDPTSARWNFEIPFATPLGTAIAQFEVSRDGAGPDADPVKRIWRARFSLDVEPAGPVHALVSLTGENTSVRLWAERPATAQQLREGVSQLNRAFSAADLELGELVVRVGAPVQQAVAPAGHFLDRAS